MTNSNTAVKVLAHFCMPGRKNFNIMLTRVRLSETSESYYVQSYFNGVSSNTEFVDQAEACNFFKTALDNHMTDLLKAK